METSIFIINTCKVKSALVLFQKSLGVKKHSPVIGSWQKKSTQNQTSKHKSEN